MTNRTRKKKRKKKTQKEPGGRSTIKFSHMKNQSASINSLNKWILSAYRFTQARGFDSGEAAKQI